MIHVRIPFRNDKDLAKAYNQAFDGVGENDWVCLLDHDVLFLTPDAISIVHFHVDAFPETGIFTCRANRIHPLAQDQLIDEVPSEETNISYWIDRAKYLASESATVTEIRHPISGFLMVISKKTWNEIKFVEGGKCLGVDNEYSQQILDSGRKILRMDNLLVWHSYRLDNIKNKSHLL